MIVVKMNPMNPPLMHYVDHLLIAQLQPWLIIAYSPFPLVSQALARIDADGVTVEYKSGDLFGLNIKDERDRNKQGMMECVK